MQLKSCVEISTKVAFMHKNNNNNNNKFSNSNFILSPLFYYYYYYYYYYYASFSTYPLSPSSHPLPISPSRNFLEIAELFHTKLS